MNEKLESIINEINEASKEIPFGNSEFQNLNFVLNAEITPERMYRHCLLRLQNRIGALRECYYSLELEDIDIEEMEEQLNDENTNKFEKRRLAVKIEQKKVNRITTEKMVQDALEEVNTLYGAFKQLPKYTREQFEAGEKKHFELKLGRELALNNNGALLSLDAMKADDFVKKVLSSNGEYLKKEVENVQKELPKLGGVNDVDKI